MGRRRIADIARIADPFGLQMTLLLGPNGPDDCGYTDEELAYGWELYHEQLLDGPRTREPGDRIWGFWRFELGIEEPPTRLERVLALEERGLLTEQERERIAPEAEHARNGGYRPNPHVVISPKEAEENYKRGCRETEREVLAIAEALEETKTARR